MKTCKDCRYYVAIAIASANGKPEFTGKGNCHSEPPRKSSERAGSYRPETHPDAFACRHFSPPLPAAPKMLNPIGYCPQCDAPGEWREKRPFGNDGCARGHVYPSQLALKEPRIPAHVPLPTAARIQIECRVDARAAIAQVEATIARYSAPKLFCFGAQAPSIKAMLSEIGWPSTNLRPVNDAVELKGLSGGVFVNMVGHAYHVPPSMMIEAQRVGMLRVSLSDEHLRAKMERLGHIQP